MTRAVKGDASAAVAGRQRLVQALYVLAIVEALFLAIVVYRVLTDRP